MNTKSKIIAAAAAIVAFVACASIKVQLAPTQGRNSNYASEIDVQRLNANSNTPAGISLEGEPTNRLIAER